MRPPSATEIKLTDAEKMEKLGQQLSELQERIRRLKHERFGAVALVAYLELQTLAREMQETLRSVQAREAQ